MFVIRDTDFSPAVYTVGHYTPSGEWYPHEDFTDRTFAEEKCAMLNGGKHPKPILHIELGAAPMIVGDQFINSKVYNDLSKDYLPIVTTGGLGGIKVSVIGIENKNTSTLEGLEEEIKRIQGL